jgi:MarR family 2-MHQ and catechol resistance regulon transcriptional repressor
MHGIDDPSVERAVRAYVKLLRASRAIISRVEPRLADTCLTSTQLGVLEAVLHKGPMTQRDLGRRVLTSAGNMTDVIDKLEGRGLLRRVRSAEDRRSVRIELTTEGRALIEDLFPDHARDIAAAMGALSQAELDTLDGLLRKLGLAPAPGVPLDAEGAATQLATEQYTIER